MFNIFKKQFIEVIDWVEEQNGVLAYRFPTLDREIQNGAQLTVRDSQMALFVNEGNIADVFSPGKYMLSTKTLPILTSLLNWDKLFQSPFKSDVYFFSTREQIDQRWGTQAPITVRDKEFGVITLRAHGTFTYHVDEITTFYQKLSGSRERYTTDDLDGQLRSMILTSLASKLGKMEGSFLDMAANQNEFSKQMKLELDMPFYDLGLKLSAFYVQSITLPDELQEHMNKRSSMNIVGDLKQYAQFQAADSISIAAKNPGGLASAGAGLGAGAMIGQQIAQSFGTLSSSDVQGNSAGQPAADPIEMLNKLHDLLSKGVISQDEFDKKKAELLNRIS